MEQAITQSGPSNTSVGQTRSARTVEPSVDIYENDHEVLVLADLPAVNRDAVDIQLDPPELTIAATSELPGTGPIRYERRFRVGSTIDPNRIEAELEDGVLRVHLPKAEPYRPRKITVQGS